MSICTVVPTRTELNTGTEQLPYRIIWHRDGIGKAFLGDFGTGNLPVRYLGTDERTGTAPDLDTEKISGFIGFDVIRIRNGNNIRIDLVQSY